ncbi:MAG: pseudouridine synthase [Chloroflexota bacterium]|jgi:23S rRNA pseudouridine2605 synthase
MAEERAQKILSRAGYGSRRSCELLIAAGRVKVNEQVIVLGAKADAKRDVILVDDQPIPRLSSKKIYIALHKPRAVLSDDAVGDDRRTVFDLVPIVEHLFVVGRLDYDSEGLILLTNDGELTNRLTHPRYGHEKEYRVLLSNRPDEKQLEIWRRGVVLEDGSKTAPAKVQVESSAGKGVWLRVVMREGKKRQIREVGRTIGLPVQRIVRLRIGTVVLGQLKPGEWRDLSAGEVNELKAEVKIKKETRKVPGLRRLAPKKR